MRSNRSVEGCRREQARQRRDEKPDADRPQISQVLGRRNEIHGAELPYVDARSPPRHLENATHLWIEEGRQPRRILSYSPARVNHGAFCFTSYWTERPALVPQLGQVRSNRLVRRQLDRTQQHRRSGLRVPATSFHSREAIHSLIVETDVWWSSIFRFVRKGHRDSPDTSGIEANAQLAVVSHSQFWIIDFNRAGSGWSLSGYGQMDPTSCLLLVGSFSCADAESVTRATIKLQFVR